MSLPGAIPALSAFSAAGGGGGGGITISLSPGDQADFGFTTPYTFNAEIATASSGTPSSYTWSISGFPGTWSIISGAGTSTVTVRITGISSGDIADAVLSCAVVVSGTTYYGSANLSYERI